MRIGNLAGRLVRLAGSGCPVRLQAVADSAWSRHRELTAEGESPELTHPYLIALALAGRGLAVIGDGGTSPSKAAEARVEPAPAGEQLADGPSAGSRSRMSSWDGSSPPKDSSWATVSCLASWRRCAARGTRTSHQ